DLALRRPGFGAGPGREAEGQARSGVRGAFRWLIGGRAVRRMGGVGTFAVAKHIHRDKMASLEESRRRLRESANQIGRCGTPGRIVRLCSQWAMVDGRCRRMFVVVCSKLLSKLIGDIWRIVRTRSRCRREATMVLVCLGRRECAASMSP